MDQDKSRGLRHFKDKRKYKGNTVKNPKYVPSKSKPNLESNWYRYQNEEVTEGQNDLTTDADFAVLADAPIAKGKHFQTKSDKLLVSETESTALSGLFTLNLERLEESLMTIPFYKRMEIDEQYFLESQINNMNSEAEEHLKKFTERNKPKISESPSKKLSEKPEEVIEKLTLEENAVVKAESSETPKENDEELEKWLDDFLNE